MIVSFTAKADAKVYEALSSARKSVHLEIDELIRGSNTNLPDVELIFCPLAFPKEELHNWREKIRRNKAENWISFEKWIAFEPFLPPGRGARATYAAWVKATMLDAEKKYPELSPARQLFDRLTA